MTGAIDRWSLTMRLLLAAIFAAILAQVGAADDAPNKSDKTIKASIRALNDRNIAAEVEGVLTQYPVREGDPVKATEVLAAVDDRRAQAALKVARISYEAAKARA